MGLSRSPAVDSCCVGRTSSGHLLPGSLDFQAVVNRCERGKSIRRGSLPDSWRSAEFLSLRRSCGDCLPCDILPLLCYHLLQPCLATFSPQRHGIGVFSLFSSSLSFDLIFWRGQKQGGSYRLQYSFVRLRWWRSTGQRNKSRHSGRQGKDLFYLECLSAVKATTVELTGGQLEPTIWPVVQRERPLLYERET
jgi:hypothetical protein